jgi:serine/threonine protein kinase
LTYSAQDNILVDEKSHVVLCDVGVDSVIRSIDAYGRYHSRYRYKAPEVMIPSLANLVAFPMFMADVWSLGRAIQEVVLMPTLYEVETNSALN